MLLVAAMAEVEAEHVSPGLEQRPDHLRAGARRSQGGDDLGMAGAAHRRCRPAGLSLISHRRGGQKVNRVLMKFDLCSFTMASSSRLLSSVCLAAIIDRIENERSTSVTDSVPSAESFRPVNGNTSGPLWHWQLMLTRQTWLTSGSTSFPIRSGSSLKIDTCWPCSEVMTYSSAVSSSSNGITGTMGPNCSSR